MFCSQSFFYITEMTQFRFRLAYFRKPVWQRIQRHGLTGIISSSVSRGLLTHDVTRCLLAHSVTRCLLTRSVTRCLLAHGVTR